MSSSTSASGFKVSKPSKDPSIITVDVSIFVNSFKDKFRFTIPSSKSSSLTTKSSLLRLLCKNSKHLPLIRPLLEDAANGVLPILIKRKSKKAKGYIILDSEEDFTSFKRSLLVKNHAKLFVNLSDAEKITTNSTKADNEIINSNFSIETKESEDQDPPVSAPSMDSQHTDTPSSSSSSSASAPQPSASIIVSELLNEMLKLSLNGKGVNGESLANHVDQMSSVVLDNLNQLGVKISDNLINSDFFARLSSLIELNVSKLIKNVEEINSTIKDEFSSNNKHTSNSTSSFTAPSPEPISDVIHYGIFCDGCYPSESYNGQSLRGVRYKCQDCFDYDLCAACEDAGVETGPHKASHTMVKIKVPITRPPGAPFGQRQRPCCTSEVHRQICIKNEIYAKDLDDLLNSITDEFDTLNPEELYSCKLSIIQSLIESHNSLVNEKDEEDLYEEFIPEEEDIKGQEDEENEKEPEVEQVEKKEEIVEMKALEQKQEPKQEQIQADVQVQEEAIPVESAELSDSKTVSEYIAIRVSRKTNKLAEVVIINNTSKVIDLSKYHLVLETAFMNKSEYGLGSQTIKPYSKSFRPYLIESSESSPLFHESYIHASNVRLESLLGDDSHDNLSNFKLITKAYFPYGVEYIISENGIDDFKRSDIHTKSFMFDAPPVIALIESKEASPSPSPVYVTPYSADSSIVESSANPITPVCTSNSSEVVIDNGLTCSGSRLSDEAAYQDAISTPNLEENEASLEEKETDEEAEVEEQSTEAKTEVKAEDVVEETKSLSDSTEFVHVEDTDANPFSDNFETDDYPLDEDEYDILSSDDYN